MAPWALILLSIETTFMVSVIGCWVTNSIIMNKELKNLNKKKTKKTKNRS